MSSQNQDDSFERADSSFGSAQYSNKKSHSQNYFQSPPLKHNDLDRHSSSGRSSSHRKSNRQLEIDILQAQEEDIREIMPEISKNILANLRNTTELESVQEQSVEHSDINKMSYMERDADNRWVVDDVVEEKKPFENSYNFPRSIQKAPEVEPEVEEAPKEESHESEKNTGSGSNFYSPRFQVEGRKKMDTKEINQLPSI